MDVERFVGNFCLREYDPENRETKKISSEARLRGKRVLVLGSYGVLSVAPQIARFADSVVAVNSSKELIDFCKRDNKKVKFVEGDVGKLDFEDKSFDVVISCLSGLHLNNDKSRILRELKRVLDDKGLLLIQEVDERGQFSKILNDFAPLDEVKLKERKEELKKILEKEFHVGVTGFKTYYLFKNLDELKKAIMKEVVHGRGKSFSKSLDESVDKFLQTMPVKKFIKVGEAMTIFVCEKH